METESKTNIKTFRKEPNSNNIDISTDKTFFSDGEVVVNRRDDLKQYFHPTDYTLKERFKTIYQITGLNDEKISRKVGIDHSTMNRYRSGIFIPITDMKILIAKAISELSGITIDSAVIWGDSVYFEKWKDNKNKGEIK